MNIIKHLLLFALAICFITCKKSGNAPSTGYKVIITSSTAFSWDIDEYIAGHNSTTIDTAGVNDTRVNYSFTPTIGQTVSVYARTPSVSDLTVAITYNGQTLGPISTVSDPSSGTTVSFDYVVTN